ARKLHDEARALPGVSAASIATTLPMSGNDMNIGFTIEGRPVDPTTRLGAAYFAISADYFSTLAIPLIKGRAFTDRVNEPGPSVLMVSQAFANKYCPNEDLLGRRLPIGYNKADPREIVGVAGDVRQSALAEPSAPQMYAPFEQTPWPFVAAVVRTTA